MTNYYTISDFMSMNETKNQTDLFSAWLKESNYNPDKKRQLNEWWNLFNDFIHKDNG